MNTINSHIKLTTPSVTNQPSRSNSITFFDTADGITRQITVSRKQPHIKDRQYVAQVRIEGGEFHAYGATATEATDAAIAGAVRLLNPTRKSAEYRAFLSQRPTQ